MSGERTEERTVEVLELPETVDEELLCLYFENKRRSGGGPLVSLHKHGDHAVLVFEEAEAARRVLSKGHHIVHNIELSVRKPASKDAHRLLLRGINPDTCTDMIELYVENMMGLTDYSLHPSPGRDSVLIHITQPFSQDFQSLSTNISKRALDGAKVTLEQIDQTDSILVENLNPSTTPDLLTLYFESKRGGSQEVNEVTMLSEGIAKVSFANYESVDHVLGRSHRLDGADLVVNAYFEQLQPKQSSPLENSEPDSKHLKLNSADLDDVQMHSSPVVMVSSISHATSQPASEPLVALDLGEDVEVEVMDDQSDDAGPPLTYIPITDPVSQALFQHSTYEQDIKKTYPDVTIQIKDDGFYIEGADRTQVEQVKCTISDFLRNVAEVRFTLKPEEAQFLARKDVKERLLGTLSQTSSTTVYAVSHSDVTVMSVSQKSADQACNFLKSQLCQFTMPVDGDNECMLYIREWTEFSQALSFCLVSHQGGNIDVLTLKGMENEKQTAILEFLTTPIERETVISMEPGMLKYIQTHCHQLLADMDQVSIFPLEDEDVCGLKIHGPAVACQMTEEVLHGVVTSVCTRTITVNAPGVTRFLTEEECQNIMNEMEGKFQVYINLKYVPWKPLSYKDIFETAWEMMSHQNFQRVSVDCSTQDLKSDLMQTNLNGASGGEGASSLADSQPPADTSATSGLLPLDNGGSSSLEEEAQLSLAIQYSMESSNWSLRDDEEQLQKALALSKMMNQQENSARTQKSPHLEQPQNSNPSSSLQEAIKAANTVQLFVFAGYSCDLIRVDIAFGKKVKQRQAEEKVEHRTIRNLSEYHKRCLEMIKRKHAVEIQVQGSILTISGFQTYVNGALCDVKLLLEKISNSVSDQEILKTVQWVHHDPNSSDTTPYSADAIVFIENSFRMRLKKVDILFDNRPHIINFEKMQEYNVSSGKSVKISRKLLELMELNENLPEEEYSLLSNLNEATKVDEESDEFQNVVKHFYETIQEYHSKIRIIQVDKLMNRLLYNQYKLKKASILQRATYPEVERTLYHGTSESSVKEICMHGFNRSFCGKNATVYGQGVYFAVNSALSVQDQYSPPNVDGYKFIFVSKVLTGDYTKGCHSMKTAPLKETGDIPLRYDSVTDDITKPSMFIIFNDTQAFPEYLITCQRIHR
ncbi:protein mono-ADP-ribosyltransferase PARP10 isoform 2-T2 [Pholidichthys leucotaenia]